MADTSRVLTGLDRLVREPASRLPLEGRRLGLLVNQAAITADLRHAVDALRGVGLDVAALLGPEHGVWGHAQDMEAVDHSLDPIHGLPVRSFYGGSEGTLAPRPEDLAGLDAVLIDLPDIGTRYYTFAASAAYLARAAHEAGLPATVLDRPNPLGGAVFEGNLVEPGFESFVGAISVPNRHALTLGELVRYAGRFGPSPFEVEVVPVSGWDRAAWHDQTGLPWVMPSPNLPTLETAAVYPGMCLLEATNLSEGRGTTRPFEIVGAPFIDARRLAALLETLELPGVRFRPLLFRPTFQKWAGRSCQGLQVHVVDRPRLAPYRLGLAVLWAARRLFAEDFAWRDQAYEFVADVPAIDLLCGTDRVRLALEAGADFSQVAAAAMSGADAYPDRLEAVRLYP